MTTVQVPVLGWAIGITILLGYAASLWWLLRRESAPVLLGLMALCGLSLSLRLANTKAFPAGLNEDEAKSLYGGAIALQQGRFFDMGFEGPLLLNSLFQVPLIPIVGPNRWAIRIYSLVGGVLTTPLAFAVGRALGLRVAASLAIGGFVATLPWSIFYGRVYFGGEMLFHELLLLAALATLVCGEGGWPPVGIGALGLSGLLYDYIGGWSMLAAPFAAAVCAPGWRRRALCLAIVVLAGVAWTPLVMAHPPATWDTGGKMETSATEGLPEILYRHAIVAMQTLVAPVGRDVWMSVRSAAMHPPLILALAVVGVFTSVRRGIFLLAAFAIGVFPGVLSAHSSSHRIMMAFPIISLAAGCAIDVLPWQRLRWATALLAVAVIGAQSVHHYFSAAFWPAQSTWVFDWERTAVVEALPPPPHPHFRVTDSLMSFFQPLTLVDSDYQLLAPGNCYPPLNDPVIYAFSQHAAMLRPFYEDLFGFERVDVFGRAFMVTLERGDWSWLRQRGWAYEAYCTNQPPQTGQVPALHQPPLGFDFWCAGDRLATHVWRGRWVGPAANLSLRFSGTGVIETSAGRFEKAGTEARIDFAATPDMPIKVTVAARGRVDLAGLLEMTPAGDHVPRWDRIKPE